MSVDDAWYAMNRIVADLAEQDQITRGVVPALRAKDLVVNLRVNRGGVSTTESTNRPGRPVREINRKLAHDARARISGSKARAITGR